MSHLTVHLSVSAEILYGKIPIEFQRKKEHLVFFLYYLKLFYV